MEEEMKAVYIVMGKNFMCRIPKKRGKGFLKSCFGWHSINEASKKFEDERPKEFTNGDYSDIDGYLNIELRMHWYSQGFEEGKSNLIKCLIKCFPHVGEFIEDADLFWEGI